MKKLYMAFILGIIMIATAIAGGMLAKEIIIDKTLLDKASANNLVFSYYEKELSDGTTSVCILADNPNDGGKTKNIIDCRKVDSKDAESAKTAIIENYINRFEVKPAVTIIKENSGGINLK